MADEITKVELLGQNNDGAPIRFTCAAGTAISQGTLMALTDPRTVAAHSTEGQPIVGVAAMDKSASDSSTSISVWTDGIFEVKCSAGVTVGLNVIASDTANQVIAALSGTTLASGQVVLGTALEEATAAETINVRVKL